MGLFLLRVEHKNLEKLKKPIQEQENGIIILDLMLMEQYINENFFLICLVHYFYIGKVSRKKLILLEKWKKKKSFVRSRNKGGKLDSLKHISAFQATQNNGSPFLTLGMG